jgi:hypothetical protein
MYDGISGADWAPARSQRISTKPFVFLRIVELDRVLIALGANSCLILPIDPNVRVIADSREMYFMPILVNMDRAMWTPQSKSPISVFSGSPRGSAKLSLLQEGERDYNVPPHNGELGALMAGRWAV